MKPLLTGAVVVIGLITCACSSSNTPTAAVPVKTITITAQPSATHPPATPTPSSPSSPVAAACQAKNLDGSVGASPVGSANGLELVIVFRNLRTAPCTLSGYPGVTQASGTPPADIGQPATPDISTPRTLVTLPPGGFASAMLKIANAANQLAVACKPVKATSLRVAPPGQRTRFNIAFGTVACKGRAKLMSVTSLVQGSAG